MNDVIIDLVILVELSLTYRISYTYAAVSVFELGYVNAFNCLPTKTLITKKQLRMIDVIII